MKRKEFIRICGILGLSLPFQSVLASSINNFDDQMNFSGKVLIIGAGAGGISAGYLLQQKGIDFQILEASSKYGGRMKIDTSFADFPIPLGAEWLETDSSIFQSIVNDTSIKVELNTYPDEADQKFVNYSWFNFFEDYLIPSIANKITYNSAVQSIDYSAEQILVNTQDKQYKADKVIIAVPLKILQDKDIIFQPELPPKQQKAIQKTKIWEGFKAFFEFSEKFYADDYEFPVPRKKGEKIFYNAALGQNTKKNILGLFVVGKPALDYTKLSDDDFKTFVLKELDEIHSNKATPSYIKHTSMNWNDEPFIKAGYMSDHAKWKRVRKLGKSVADKIYFAGGAYTDGKNWVSVHTAAQSAKAAVEEIVS